MGTDGRVRFGHPSGTLRVGAEAKLVDGEWTVTKAIMSRSARVLMEGWVRVPHGRTVDRKGNPVLIKLKGTVEAFYR